MRFYSPMSRLPKWYLTIFFREVGKPQLVRIGKSHQMFGRGPEHEGKLAICQIEIKEEHASVEVFPGSVVLGIVCAPEPGIDQHFRDSLSPADEAELVRPSEILVADGALMSQVSEMNPSWLQKQLDGRKRLVG